MFGVVRNDESIQRRLVENSARASQSNLKYNAQASYTEKWLDIHLWYSN